MDRGFRVGWAYRAALFGIEAVVVEVQAARALGQPRAVIVAQAEPEVKEGRERLKVALQGAELWDAAGGRNLLLIGPPGVGKTSLARRLATILPPLARDDALEVTRVHSAAGLVQPGSGLIEDRPFRAPHHSITTAGLVAGGVPPRPGEISLAAHGVLFLDELPEFPRAVLESLRQPLEDGQVAVVRAMGRAKFPARFLLAAAMNPCPCVAFLRFEANRSKAKGFRVSGGAKDARRTPPLRPARPRLAAA